MKNLFSCNYYLMMKKKIEKKRLSMIYVPQDPTLVLWLGCHMCKGPAGLLHM